jgi:mannose-1-phosphate guanylyltransferase
MPVGERAILELVVEQLADHGITDITMSVGYLSHLIRAVFDTRQPPDVAVRYVQEPEPLGTAGPLRLVDGLESTFIALNGDVLTDLGYSDFIAYHRANENVMTIAAKARTTRLDYGVLHLDDTDSPRLTGFEEKPEISSPVSMGIYALEAQALGYIPEEGPFDIPDLVRALLRDGKPVGAYVHEGLWFDIGRKEDYEKAVIAWGTRDLDLASVLHETLPRAERTLRMVAPRPPVHESGKRA